MKKLNLSTTSFLTAGGLLISLVLLMIWQWKFAINFDMSTTGHVLNSLRCYLFSLSFIGFAVYLLLTNQKGSLLYKTSVAMIIVEGAAIVYELIFADIIPSVNGIMGVGVFSAGTYSVNMILSAIIFACRAIVVVFMLLAFTKMSDNKILKGLSCGYAAVLLIDAVYSIIRSIVEMVKGNAVLGNSSIGYVFQDIMLLLLIGFFAMLGWITLKENNLLEGMNQEGWGKFVRRSLMWCAIGGLAIMLSYLLYLLRTLMLVGTVSSEAVLTTLVEVLIVAIIAHMVYILLSNKKLKKMEVADNASLRAAQGLQPMTDDEAAELMQKMDDILSEWTPFNNDNGEQMYIMTKNSQTKKTRALLDEVRAAMPDNESVVEHFNEMIDNYNDNTKYRYNGSTKYVVLAAVVGIVLSIIAGSWTVVMPLFISQIALYILASMTPTYILNRIELKPARPKFMSGFIAGIFGITATAATYKITTHYTDGTSKTEYDNSEKWVSMIISLFLILVVVFFMFIPALVNYIRNYILKV